MEKKLIRVWKYNEVTTGDIAMWECLAHTERPTLELVFDGDREEILVYE